MYEKAIEDLKASFEPLMALAETNRKALEKLAAVQSEYLSDCLNTSIEQVRELSTVKDASTAAALQFKYLKTFEAKLNATAEKNLAAFNEMKGVLSTMLESQYAENLARMDELNPFQEEAAAPTKPAPKKAVAPAAKPAARKAPARKPAAKKAAPAPKAAPKAEVKPAAKPAPAVKTAAAPAAKAAVQPAAATPAAPADKPAAAAQSATKA